MSPKIEAHVKLMTGALFPVREIDSVHNVLFAEPSPVLCAENNNDAFESGSAEFVESAKGAVARRQTVKELRRSLGGALDTAPVLREFLKSSNPPSSTGLTV